MKKMSVRQRATKVSLKQPTEESREELPRLLEPRLTVDAIREPPLPPRVSFFNDGTYPPGREPHARGTTHEQ